ncbi:MAG: hypothetical protein J7496_15555 [Novosphingobium sp.]|nr:hypothetical protein [Novosphingobium sp.]MBO9603917.1 hypothetical protein [Novosphingobium sp.]
MIAASAPKRLALRLIAALLVLVAATHAVLPAGPQAELRSGSAFSAATVDVAIGCDRQRIETRALPDRPAPPVPDCAPVLVALPARNLVIALPLRSRSHAPPQPAPALSPLNPRAPPAA